MISKLESIACPKGSSILKRVSGFEVCFSRARNYCQHPLEKDRLLFVLSLTALVEMSSFLREANREKLLNQLHPEETQLSITGGFLPI